MRQDNIISSMNSILGEIQEDYNSEFGTSINIQSYINSKNRADIINILKNESDSEREKKVKAFCDRIIKPKMEKDIPSEKGEDIPLEERQETKEESNITEMNKILGEITFKKQIKRDELNKALTAEQSAEILNIIGETRPNRREKAILKYLTQQGLIATLENNKDFFEEQPPKRTKEIELEEEELGVDIDIQRGTYKYGEIQMTANPKLIEGKELEEFKKKLAEKGMFVDYSEGPENLKKLKNFDANLYNFYQIIDEKKGTRCQQEYFDAFILDEEMPTDVTYHLKKQEVKITDLEPNLQKKLLKTAAKMEKQGLVSINDEKHEKLLKRAVVSAGMMIIALLATIGIKLKDVNLQLPSNTKNIEQENEQENLEDGSKENLLGHMDKYKDTLKVTLGNDEKGTISQNDAAEVAKNTVDKIVANEKNKAGKNQKETVSQNGVSEVAKNAVDKIVANEKNEAGKNQRDVGGKVRFKEALKVEIEEMQQVEDTIGIGSTAYIDEGIYTYDSEKNGPIGKMENRENKNVKIDYIATIGEDGLYKGCYNSGTISEIMEANPGLKIEIHIASTDDKDYGWMSFEEVQQKFIDQAQKETVEMER